MRSCCQHNHIRLRYDIFFVIVFKIIIAWLAKFRKLRRMILKAHLQVQSVIFIYSKFCSSSSTSFLLFFLFLLLLLPPPPLSFLFPFISSSTSPTSSRYSSTLRVHCTFIANQVLRAPLPARGEWGLRPVYTCVTRHSPTSDANTVVSKTRF